VANTQLARPDRHLPAFPAPAIPVISLHDSVAAPALAVASTAAPILRSLAVVAPASNLEALFAEALACHQEGRLAKAAALYKRILLLRSDLPEVHNNLGIALFGLGRNDEALAAYRSAIDLKLDYPEAHCNRGSALATLGRFAEAQAACCHAIALNPGFVGAYSNLANTLRELGRLDEAEHACRTAIALDPKHAEALTNLGHILKSLGRLGAAEVVFRRATAIMPDDAQAHCGLGNVLADLDRPVEAEAAYRRAIALNRGLAGAHHNLALTLTASGRFAEARRASERAIELAPRQTSYYATLAELRSFTAGDRYLTALEGLAKDATSLSAADQVHLHFALAKAYADLGHSEREFAHLLSGNALKRAQMNYDEAATLGRMQRARELLTPEFIRTCQGAGERSPAPIFIIGMPRSGTTLIEQILASHHQVFGAGELKLIEQAAGGIRSVLPGAPDYPEMLLHMGPAHFQALGALYVRELTRRVPLTSRIIDKMPSNFIFAGLIHLALPNATIIHVMRDPLDTCASCFSKHFTEGQAHTYDLAELGRYYRSYRELMAHWHRVLPPGRILDVHYEDVVADLEGAARRLVAHCGLPWDDRCLDFHRTQRTIKTASATQVRRPIYRNSVGFSHRYKAFLGPLVSELVNPIAT